MNGIWKHLKYNLWGNVKFVCEIIVTILHLQDHKHFYVIDVNKNLGFLICLYFVFIWQARETLVVKNAIQPIRFKRKVQFLFERTSYCRKYILPLLEIMQSSEISNERGLPKIAAINHPLVVWGRSNKRKSRRPRENKPDQTQTGDSAIRKADTEERSIFFQMCMCVGLF